MDPIATAVAKAGAATVTAAEKEGEKFLSTVLGETKLAVGGLLALPLKKRLYTNLIAAVLDAKQKLRAAGVTEKEIPLKIIHPLLEGASLEEQPELRAIWGNMIANATDERSQTVVKGSFAEALRQLSPPEVRFLDKLYFFYEESAANRSYIFLDGIGLESYGVLLEIFHTANHEETASAENLRESHSAFETALATFLHVGILRRHIQVMQGGTYSDPIPHDAEYLTKETYPLTPFGSELVQACRPPKAK